MKLNKLYIAILLFAGILTSCKVGKSYVRAPSRKVRRPMRPIICKSWRKKAV